MPEFITNRICTQDGEFIVRFHNLRQAGISLKRLQAQIQRKVIFVLAVIVSIAKGLTKQGNSTHQRRRVALPGRSFCKRVMCAGDRVNDQITILSFVQ